MNVWLKTASAKRKHQNQFRSSTVSSDLPMIIQNHTITESVDSQTSFKMQNIPNSNPNLFSSIFIPEQKQRQRRIFQQFSFEKDSSSDEFSQQPIKNRVPNNKINNKYQKKPFVQIIQPNPYITNLLSFQDQKDIPYENKPFPRRISIQNQLKKSNAILRRTSSPINVLSRDHRNSSSGRNVSFSIDATNKKKSILKSNPHKSTSWQYLSSSQNSNQINNIAQSLVWQTELPSKERLVQNAGPSQERYVPSSKEQIRTNERHTLSKRSNRSKTNSKASRTLHTSQMRTSRRNQIKVHIISLIEYCSNQVGLAIYNLSTGQIKLVQIIQRITYYKTISTLQRYYPKEILYSKSLQCTLLIKKLMYYFRNVSFRGMMRNAFDQTKGYFIYRQKGNAGCDPNMKFLTFAALHCLVTYVEDSLGCRLQYSVLNIKWHKLQQVLVVDAGAVLQLQLFLNAKTKLPRDTFAQNFKCLTYGGIRMLRANLLQPLLPQSLIRRRQQLCEQLLRNSPLYNLLMKQLPRFRAYDPLTAKFIQSPKQQNLRSLKSFLSALYSLSHLCNFLLLFAAKIQPYIQTYHLIQLHTLIKDDKIGRIKSIIQQHFQQNMLRDEKQINKKDKFIFLFKVELMQDNFAEILRYTYLSTKNDIHKLFDQVKKQMKVQLKLLYNEARGYFLSSKQCFNQRQVQETLGDTIYFIGQNRQKPTFTTAMLDSLNNRLKENQRKLILQSQFILRGLILRIQQDIDILFDIDEQLSIIDMILSFAQFVKKYTTVQFSTPIFVKDSSTSSISYSNLRTVWTHQKYSQQSKPQSGQFHCTTIFQKQANSSHEKCVLESNAYLVLLAQIGCLVPASALRLTPFHSLFTRIAATENDLEANLSKFQNEVVRFRNILEEADAHSFLILDELVKGTQYDEEIALSMAVLQQINLSHILTFIICSDRFLYDKIKNMGVKAEGHKQEKQVQFILEEGGFSDEFRKDFDMIKLEK